MTTQYYLTRDGDMLDQICFNFYGRTNNATEFVLNANPGLAKLGPVYQAMIKISLPELPEALNHKINKQLPVFG